MKVKQGIIAKMKHVLTKEGMFKAIFAEGEEGGSSTPQPNSAPQVNYEELIAQARQQEKNKLYPKIEALQTKCNDYVLEVASLKKQNEKLAEENEQLKNQGNVTESTKVKNLKAEIDTYKERIKELEGSVKSEDTIRAEVKQQLEQEYETKVYKVEQMASDEFKGKIIPELVTGNTKEEIDQSLALAKQRYEEIVAGVTGVTAPQQPQQGQPQQQVAQQGINNVNLPPVGNPSSNGVSYNNIQAQDVQNMTPEEYAEFRKKIFRR